MNKNNFPWLGEQIVTPAEISQTVEQLATRLDQDYGQLEEEVVIIGIMRGAFIFLADLVRSMQTAVDIDFITTRAYGKGDVQVGEVQLLHDLQVNIKDKHVIVVDDIVDTGKTLMFLDPILRAKGPKTLEYCMLFDKPARREADFSLTVKYIGQEVPNVFLLGYGLDGLQLGRNLPAIYALKPDQG